MGTLPSSRHAGLDMTELLGKCLFGFGGHSQPIKFHHDSKSRAPWESNIYGDRSQPIPYLGGEHPVALPAICAFTWIPRFWHVWTRIHTIIYIIRHSLVPKWSFSGWSSHPKYTAEDSLETHQQLWVKRLQDDACAPWPHTLEIHAWRKVHQQPISELYNVVDKPHQSFWMYLNLNLQMNLAKNGAPDCKWFVAFLIGSVYFHHKKSGLIIPEYWPHSLIIWDIKVVWCHQTFPNMFWSQELAPEGYVSCNIRADTGTFGTYNGYITYVYLTVIRWKSSTSSTTGEPSFLQYHHNQRTNPIVIISIIIHSYPSRSMIFHQDPLRSILNLWKRQFRRGCYGPLHRAVAQPRGGRGPVAGCRRPLGPTGTARPTAGWRQGGSSWAARSREKSRFSGWTFRFFYWRWMVIYL